MLFFYNLAKEVKKGEKKSVRIKLPANVMRTLDGDLKTEESTLLQL
jgi:ribosomal protein L28